MASVEASVRASGQGMASVEALVELLGWSLSQNLQDGWPLHLCIKRRIRHAATALKSNLAAWTAVLQARKDVELSLKEGASLGALNGRSSCQAAV